MSIGRAERFALLGGGVVAFLIAQFVPVQRVNPPAVGDVSATSEIETTLRRACYDCHSNETHWPWYSRIAPVSWLVARDVEQGRKQLNFSEWDSYLPVTRRRKLHWMDRALREGAMPPWEYRLMHPAARLTQEDRAVLERWIDMQISTALRESEIKPISE
jgi:hypothetical protein